MKTKEEMIKYIIDQDVLTNGGENDWYLKEILYNGFEGYNKMSLEEITKMYKEYES